MPECRYVFILGNSFFFKKAICHEIGDVKRVRIGVACPFICWSGAGRPSDPTHALLISSLGITVL